ncbi:putative nucleic acid-binding Zn-ribbon protein [Paucibacter oligotrophus]|uniref:Putative nucleic acid-binding Zn-ribbon protein n=1 Tax=Roseateles oligotrophus TaxID=1769250 RepID=A0A840L315_9BURK|nr:hypothetical protein [Roseateles oligotrophus]MBB4842221.1 putative nucleic acid-binding Zn-ribbon protein [Roseateles oligotrophus]
MSAARLACGLGLLAALLAPPAQAKPSEQQLESRYQSLQQLRALERRAEQAQAGAQALEGGSQGLVEQPAALLQRAQALRSRLLAQQQDSPCVQALPQAQQRLSAGVQAWQAALQASYAAVQAVAAARPGELAQAGRSADQAFDQRQAAEQALSLARKDWLAALSQCRSQLAQGDGDVQDLSGSSRRLRERALALTESTQGLRAETQDLLDQPLAKTLPGYQARPAAWPQGRGLEDLRQALAGQVPSESLGLQPADWSALAELNRQAQGLAPLQALLPRLQDALAYASQADKTVAGEAEAQALGERSQRAQQDLNQGLRSLQTGAQSPAALLERLLQTQQGLAAQLQLLADKLPAAQQQAAATAAQARLSLPPLQAALREAGARAQQAWAEAYLEQHGQLPGGGLAKAAPPPPPPPVPVAPPPGPTAALAAPNLADHAYQFFKELGAELPGFGAYSYLLLHSGSDLAKPDVARRYAKVLAVLQREREASTVAASEARQVHLFCLPGSASSYADDLGKQILFRAQSGLLTRPEMKKRLGPKGGTGPFLITLPLRLSEARSSTPLLFVDLSLYPEDTVADLLSSYMSDLLRDFPREQLRWKPPLQQQVALTMIGLSRDVSGLFMSVLPTASAAEARPRP